MYIPGVFKEKDKKRILSLIRENAFATLVTSREGVPFATHLPLLLEDGEQLVIVGHMAKANEQWQHFYEDQQVLAIFQGPHAYISPSNYEKKTAPTWNYAAVHMCGRPRLIDDEQQLRNIVESLSNKYEMTQSTPWVPEYPDALLNAIVGFEITIEKVEAKFKLSQNRPEGDRKRIIDTLSSSSKDDELGVARLMQENELRNPRNFD